MELFPCRDQGLLSEHFQGWGLLPKVQTLLLGLVCPPPTPGKKQGHGQELRGAPFLPRSVCSNGKPTQGVL